jgi:DNA-binding transcriptional MocR family regulator
MAGMTMLETGQAATHGAGRPLYLRIADWVRQRIESGEWQPGTRLPPVRALATSLQVNRGSVAAAYKHLARSGVLETGVGQGTFVKGNAGEPPDAYPAQEDAAFWSPMLAEMDARLGPPKPGILDSAQGITWVPEDGAPSRGTSRIAMDLPLADCGLSHELIQTSLCKVAASFPKEALAYGHPQGLLRLRAQLADRALAAGMRLDPKHILICNGTQQALSLVSAVLVHPGDVVLMENPGYPGAARAFRMHGAKVIGIPMDADGMQVDVLEAMVRDYKPKLIYTVPNFQVPTGTTLIQPRRYRLYALATQYHVPILEDEYVSQLFYDVPPPPSLKSQDRNGLVIYVGTFSKTLGAGLRLGWIAAHPALAARLVQAKEVQDIHTSLLSQLLADDLLRNGSYDEHLALLREHYGERYRRFINALRREFRGLLEYNKPGGAFSIWATAPDNVSIEGWLTRAKTRGLDFHSGSSYFLGDVRSRSVQLCFSQLSISQIDKAMKTLALAYREAVVADTETSPYASPFLPFA